MRLHLQAISHEVAEKRHQGAHSLYNETCERLWRAEQEQKAAARRIEDLTEAATSAREGRGTEEAVPTSEDEEAKKEQPERPPRKARARSATARAALPDGPGARRGRPFGVSRAIQKGRAPSVKPKRDSSP